ncbi:MAG: hypothetical protein OEX08_00590 [Candidatus Nomurabacteria bacterium]|nr:hypothetical protein [Candidatus Nomurabacteria bacterium]
MDTDTKNIFLKRIEDIRKKLSDSSYSVEPFTERLPIEDRMQRLEADDREQDIRLKKLTLKTLFWFLGLETLAIFTIIFLQGFGVMKLEEWTLKLLTISTITQITVMLKIAVQYLFPNGSKK